MDYVVTLLAIIGLAVVIIQGFHKLYHSSKPKGYYRYRDGTRGWRSCQNWGRYVDLRENRWKGTGKGEDELK
jgi:hypothetical protein